MKYEEFVNAVKTKLQKDYKYSKEKTDKYFNTPDVKEVLDDNYKHINDKSSNITVSSTASTLDMLYE